VDVVGAHRAQARLQQPLDQVVPYAAAGPRSAELLPNGTLKTYQGFPHGMPTVEADTINADLLAFLQSLIASRGGVRLATARQTPARGGFEGTPPMNTDPTSSTALSC
jgi:hypothetical protein